VSTLRKTRYGGATGLVTWYYFYDIGPELLGQHVLARAHRACEPKPGWVVVFVASYFSSTDVSMSFFAAGDYDREMRDAMIQPSLLFVVS
jgi:hypothetical protein